MNARVLSDRRRASVLVVMVVFASHLLPQLAMGQSGAKEGMLRQVVRGGILPGYEGLATECRALNGAVAEFVKAPAPESLEKARRAWTATLMASRRIQWLQSGPIADREYISTFYYSKVLPLRIEAAVKSCRGGDEPGAVELGAAAKGTFALEYLLFDRKGGGPGNAPGSATLEAFSTGDGAAGRKQYLLALARDLEAKAGQLAGDWAGTGEQGASAKFVAGGQVSLNLVINQLAQNLEQWAEQRIQFILELPSPISSQLDRIEGSWSGTSQQSLVTLLQGARSLYRGAGSGEALEGYLKGLNAPLAERFGAQLEAALAAAGRIPGPLEQAVPGNRPAVDNALEKLRALEVLCKTDLASALGVTLTFSSNDGD